MRSFWPIFGYMIIGIMFSVGVNKADSRPISFVSTFNCVIGWPLGVALSAGWYLGEASNIDRSRQNLP